MKKRFTEEQIVRNLQETESTGNVRDVCRKYNVTEQSVYRGRKQYAGMEVRDIRQYKALYKENEDLKKVKPLDLSAA